MRYRINVLIGLASGLLWALNNLFVGQAGGVLSDVLYSPIVFAAINDLCSALFLSGIYFFTGKLKNIIKEFSYSKVWPVMIAALLGGPFGQIMYFSGIKYAGTSLAIIFTSLYPLIACIFARIFLHQKLTIRIQIGIILAIAGSIIIGGNLGIENPMTSNVMLGIALSMLAAIAWGSEIVIAVSAMKKISAEAAILIREWTSGTTLVITVIILYPIYQVFSTLISFPAMILFLCIAGIFGGLSYYLWYYANRMIGCVKGTATNLTYILWGIFFQFLVTGQVPAVSIISGALIIFVGVFLAVYTKD